MAINKNHEFEDLDGVKCAIVEKNVATERMEFLKNLLEGNGYKVIVVKSPPPKTAAPVAAAAPDTTSVSASAGASASPNIELPATYTVGVTDVTFNVTNAVFGRSLKTKDGHVVTLAYWNQKENVSNDDVPYFEKY